MAGGVQPLGLAELAAYPATAACVTSVSGKRGGGGWGSGKAWVNHEAVAGLIDKLELEQEARRWRDFLRLATMDQARLHTLVMACRAYGDIAAERVDG